jgi:hypothetical protein
MMWLVIGLPALVVVAGFTTLGIALHAGGADAVPAEVRRTAQVQVENLRADEEAMRLGLAAELSVQPDTGAAWLALRDGAAIDEARLRLRLSHPAQAAADHELILVRGHGGWYGRIASARTHDWNIELAPLDGRWRLGGRLGVDEARTLLAPRLRP